MKRLFLITVLCLLAAPVKSVTAQDTTNVRFMRHADRQQADEKYFFELLNMALKKTANSYGPYVLQFTEKGYSQREGLNALRQGSEFEVLYTMTSKAREIVLRPVRIPLMKGLAGHRINLVKAEDKNVFGNVYLKADLNEFTFIQGEGWPDTEILRHNGLNVVGADESRSLFSLLAAKNIDAFPRAASEISREQEAITRHHLAIDEHIVIYYPTAFYFFVNKGNAHLAERIQTGLNKAVHDGSFDVLFDTYYRESIEQLHLQNRRYIGLENPLLPDRTPLIRDELWMDAHIKN